MNNKIKKNFIKELDKKISAVDKIPKDVIRCLNTRGNKFSGSSSIRCPNIDFAFNCVMYRKLLSLEYDYVEYISMGQFIEELMGDARETTVSTEGIELMKLYVPVCFIKHKKQPFIYE